MKKIQEAESLFYREFGRLSREVYFSHGRLEIIGNHTDHNHGLCLVAGSSLGITACVAGNDIGVAKVASEGFPSYEVHLDDLSKKSSEEGTSLSLTKGVLFALKRMGYKIGGFFAAMSSDIPSGSGVSSSACFEAMIAEIISSLYNDGKIPPSEMAFACQYAEVTYFGKPCGLLDQIGACYGGVDYLDFKDPTEPIVEPLKFDLPLSLVLVNPGSSHDGLTSYYASIPADMKEVAGKLFGKKVLRDVDPEEFHQKIGQPSVGVSERAKLRALHFFDENRRVLDAREALLRSDMASFLNAIRLSGESSRTLLQNTMVPGQYRESPQEAIDVAKKYIGDGAVRVMGGGFAGSILCFVLKSQTPSFLAGMRSVYGEKAVIEESITFGGPRKIAESAE